MAENVQKRCSKSKKSNGATKIKFLKSCLDKKEFCSNGKQTDDYYDCMRKYFSRYPNEINLNKKNGNKKENKSKKDPCKGSKKFIVGDVVMGDFRDLAKKILKEDTNTNLLTTLEQIGTIPYRAKITSSNNKTIGFSLDDYKKFKEKIDIKPDEKGEPQNSIIKQVYDAIKKKLEEKIIKGGAKSYTMPIAMKKLINRGENTRKQILGLPHTPKPSHNMPIAMEKIKNYRKKFIASKAKKKEESNFKDAQMAEMKTPLTVPFKDFEESGIKKYKPSSAVGYIKEGLKAVKGLIEPISKEINIAQKETSVNLGKEPNSEPAPDNPHLVSLLNGTLTMEQLLTIPREKFEKSENKDKYLEKLYRIYEKYNSDNSYNGPFIKDINKILKDFNSITDEQKKDLISKIKEWNKKKVLNKSKSQHGGNIDNTIQKLFPDNSSSSNISNNNIIKQLDEIDKKNINPQEELKQIKQNIYDKEIVGTEDGYGLKIKSTNFGKKVKNFLKNAMKFRKSQMLILALIICTFIFKKYSLYIALGAILLYIFTYSNLGDILPYIIFLFMALIILKTITGMLHLFSKNAECTDAEFKNSSELIDYQSNKYIYTLLGSMLLLISIRGLCNFVPWLSFDWYIWGLGLGIYLLQQTITLHGPDVKSNEKSETLYISTISNAFFVLCSFNALYQYISDSGESKIDDLSGLVNFGDILRSSYYLMDENNNSNIALPTTLDESN